MDNIKSGRKIQNRPQKIQKQPQKIQNQSQKNEIGLKKIKNQPQKNKNHNIILNLQLILTRK